MSMFGNRTKGQFKEWKIESICNSTEPGWYLKWEKRILQKELTRLFPGYIQRHIDGGAWKPLAVGYYVLE